VSGKGKFEFGAEDFGEDPEIEIESGVPKKERLGPMAAAARDGGAASRAMRAGGRVSEIEVLELAGEMKALRAAKLDMRLIPLDEIDETHLRRDRQTIQDEALEELKHSISENGLGSPIRVDLLEDGRYGLNQGRRRLLAFKQLLVESGEERFARIPALVDRETERTSAYRRMVDENLIREDVSYAEMAMLAMAFAEESGRTAEDAVAELFASTVKAKRYHIACFVQVLAAVGDLLRFANALPRKTGVDLAAKLKGEDGNVVVAALRNALLDAAPGSAEEERAILEKMAAPQVRRTASPPRTRPARFHVMVGNVEKRRVDVTIGDRRLVITGLEASEIDAESVRAFVIGAANRKSSGGA
jgi:ParB family chromosome partitioning protein